MSCIRAWRNVLHLIGNIYQAQDHVERGPECCNVLCLYLEDEHIRLLQASTGSRSGGSLRR